MQLLSKLSHFFCVKIILNKIAYVTTYHMMVLMLSLCYNITVLIFLVLWMNMNNILQA